MAPLGSLSQFPGRVLRGCEGLLQVQGGQRDAVHDGQPDPHVVAAHGARVSARIGRSAHDWRGEAARRCGAVCVARPGHAGDCEGRGGKGAVGLREEVADVAAQRERMTDCVCWEVRVLK
ncbi:hypothetical protein TcYC6_0026080 [Trypanosoma cruzi]|nr:hypothetical protein TcYC6_0010300 [Trypanosoma cruzi]KAF8289734.1 hypothetical protein TcYC6_0026080 [Trypanosoma cruzi]RNC53151.1 putative elongation factor 1-gamma (EF-1-gamma) [Trypanosoma cruzi]